MGAIDSSKFSSPVWLSSPAGGPDPALACKFTERKTFFSHVDRTIFEQHSDQERGCPTPKKPSPARWGSGGMRQGPLQSGNRLSSRTRRVPTLLARTTRDRKSENWTRSSMSQHLSRQPSILSRKSTSLEEAPPSPR